MIMERALGEPGQFAALCQQGKLRESHTALTNDSASRALPRSGFVQVRLPESAIEIHVFKGALEIRSVLNEGRSAY
jgi:hypothetical protein